MTERMVVVVRSEKSVALAYIFLIFLGQLGIHRFYVGRIGTGIVQLILCIIGWSTVWFYVGIVPLVILGIWLIVDLFITAGMVRAANAKLRAEE